jgi:excisionase family DNA binding protein
MVSPILSREFRDQAGIFYGVAQLRGLRIQQRRRGASRMATQPRVLTVGDLSGYLRVHRSTIYRLLKKGQLPGFKIGSDWRFNTEAIDEWRLHQGALQAEDEHVDTEERMR